jgi:TolA-binding protein
MGSSMMKEMPTRRLRQAAWVGAAVLAAALPLLSAAGQEKKEPDAATKKLMAANGLFARGLLKPAAEEYEAFLAQYPRHEQVTAARYGLGACRFQLGQYDEAIPLLEQVLKDRKFERRDSALAALGHCHLSKGAYDHALAALDELLAKHPQSEHAEVALLNRAQVLHLKARHADAVAACEAFLRKYANTPRRASAQYTLALARFALGQHAEAAQTLQKLLRQADGSIALDATLLLGQCYEQMDKLKEAVVQYRAAVGIAPAARRIEAQYSLGVALYKARDYKGAVKALTAALAAKPTGRYARSALFQLALAQLAAGMLPDARKTLAAVIQDDPDRKATARYWLAQCHMTERQFAAARAILDELSRLKKPPADLEAVLYDRAICAMAMGRYDQAAEELAALRKAWPKGRHYADATYRQAFCLHELKNYSESLTLCLQVASQPKLAIAPAAEELAADDLFLLGRYAEAARAFEALVKAAETEDRKLRLSLGLIQCEHFQRHFAKVIELAEPLTRDYRALRDEKLRRALFLLGDAQLQSGKHREAARTLARYVPLAGEDRAEAELKLGLAQLRGGQEDAALRTFESLLRRPEPSRWSQQAMFESAQVHYQRRRPEKAAPLLDKLLASQPPEELAAPGLYLRAWIDYDAKRYADAAGRFAELARRFGKHALAADAAYQQGVSLVEADQAEQALGALQAYVKAHPKAKHVADAQHHVGRCLARLGRHGEAAKVFAALVAEQKAPAADLLYELALSQRESKDAAAAATYQRLLKDYPASRVAVSGRLELAEMLYAAGNYAEAAKLLEQVAADRAADAKTLAVAQYRLGWCYDKQDLPAKAAEVFSAFAARDRDSEFAPSAMYQAGVAYAKLEKLDEAASQFSTLITRFAKHDLAAVAMLKLGEVQAQRQDYDKSAQTYRRFLQEFPKSKFAFLAQFGLGWAAENQRRYDEARQWYGKVVAAHNGPTAARAQFQIGECHYAEGKFEKAAAELLKVEIVYAYPEWSARALYEAGRAFEAMKRGDQAKQQYQACVAKYKDTPSAQQAARRLKELEPGKPPASK